MPIWNRILPYIYIFILSLLVTLSVVTIWAKNRSKMVTDYLPTNNKTLYFAVEFSEYAKRRPCSMVMMAPWSNDTVQLEFFMPTKNGDQHRTETFSSKYYLYDNFDVSTPVKREKMKMYDDICEYLNLEYTMRSKMYPLKTVTIFLRSINFDKFRNSYVSVEYFVVEHWKTETIVDFSN